MAASSPGLRFDGQRRSAYRSRWPRVDPVGPDAAPAPLLGDRPDEGYPANTRIHQGGGLAARTPGVLTMHAKSPALSGRDRQQGCEKAREG